MIEALAHLTAFALLSFSASQTYNLLRIGMALILASLACVELRLFVHCLSACSTRYILPRILLGCNCFCLALTPFLKLLLPWLTGYLGCLAVDLIRSDPVLCCLLVSWFVLYPFFVLVVARQIGETLCRLVSWLRQAMFALFSYLFGHIFPSS